MDQDNAAGKALQERLGRKRQALLGPIMRENEKPDPEIEPEWFQQVNQRAIFVCMCGSSAMGRDQIELPDALLSMASQAKDKKAISVGVAYVGYKAPDESGKRSTIACYAWVSGPHVSPSRVRWWCMARFTVFGACWRAECESCVWPRPGDMERR
eukprot:symbB.v1.2.028909.t1/scaffold3110.1/size63354/2